MTPWTPPNLLDAHPTTVAVLTPRQAQILEGMCRGLTNQQIGNELYLGVESVKTYARRLFRALQARDRCHAVALASQLTIVIKERA